MKSLCVLICLALSVTGFSEEEKVPFKEMFAEAVKLNKALAKTISEEDHGGEFGKDMATNERATYSAMIELLEFAEKSDDAVMKAKILKVELGWAINDCYIDLEDRGGALERMAVRARKTKYERWLKQLDEVVDSAE